MFVIINGKVDVNKYLDKANNEGRVFAFHYRDTIDASSIIEFAMLIPSAKIEVLPTLISCDRELEVTFYQDVTITEETGVDVTSSIRCMNQYNPKTTLVQEVLANPTITNYGETNYPTYIHASWFTSGQVLTGVNWITKPNVYYSVKIENILAQAGILEFHLYWIEP